MKHGAGSQENELVLPLNQPRLEIWGLQTRAVRKYRSRAWGCNLALKRSWTNL